MSPRSLARSLLLGSALMILAGGVAEANEPRTRTSSARTPQSGPRESRDVVPFKTERTDSWLCQNVSAFFCCARPGTVSEPAATPNSRRRGRG